MTNSTNYPVCPYCEFPFDEEDTWYGKQEISKGDCDISLLTCENDDCKKQFHVSCVHEIKFKPVDEDGDDLIL